MFFKGLKNYVLMDECREQVVKGTSLKRIVVTIRTVNDR